MPSRPVIPPPTADQGLPPPVSRVRAVATVLALVVAYLGFAIGGGGDVRLAAGPVVAQSGSSTVHLAAREAGRVVLSADRSADPTLPPPAPAIAGLAVSVLSAPDRAVVAVGASADRPALPPPTGAHRPRAPPVRSA